MELLAGRFSNSRRTPLLRAIEAYRSLDLSQSRRKRSVAPTVRRAKFLRPVELARLVDRYESGARIKDLATEFGIDRRTVSHHLRSQHVALRPYPSTAEQIDEMVRLYESGLPLAAVGQKTGFSPFVVQRQLRARGVVIRPKARRKK